MKKSVMKHTFGRFSAYIQVLNKNNTSKEWKTQLFENKINCKFI